MGMILELAQGSSLQTYAHENADTKVDLGKVLFLTLILCAYP